MNSAKNTRFTSNKKYLTYKKKKLLGAYQILSNRNKTIHHYSLEKTISYHTYYFLTISDLIYLIQFISLKNV